MPALARSAPVPMRSRNAVTEPTVGQYAIAQQLAGGRWFNVYRARPASDESPRAASYALKTIRSNGPDADLARALLRREAAVAATTSHANLVSLLDAEIDTEMPYVVFPFLEGQTLAAQATGLIAVPQALWYVRQIASALDTLHQGGWLHGDVRPSNVMISPQGHATLIDLGLARRLRTEECRSDQWLAGDLAFVAPECLLPGRVIGTTADIFSLGVLLLRILAGPELWPHGSSFATRDAIAQLRSAHPQVSREVAHLLANMTAQEPLRRPSAGELAERVTRLEIESLMQW